MTSLTVSIQGNKEDKYDEREVPEKVGMHFNTMDQKLFLFNVIIGRSFSEANGFDYFIETSALGSTNVDELFHEIAHRLTIETKQNDQRFTYSLNGKPKNFCMTDTKRSKATMCPVLHKLVV